MTLDKTYPDSLDTTYGRMYALFTMFTEKKEMRAWIFFIEMYKNI